MSSGKEENADNTPAAKEAFVFLLNCVNGSWKLPVGYFLITSLSGEQKANLINMCLGMLHDVGVKVCSLTFDGARSNVSAVEKLGVDFDINTEKTCFPHPISGDPIFIMPDPPHMLKLVRNTLGNKKIMYDEDSKPILWEYIEKLVKTQEREGLHLANKLTSRHVKWQQEKMKVKLAAQTLSLSVAKGLQYLRKNEIYSEEFEGSEATQRFATLINDVFDILNSRNLLGKWFKAGLQAKNRGIIAKKIEEAIKYINGLKTARKGQPLYTTLNKTGFIGLVLGLRSFLGIFDHYSIKNCEGGLRFLLGYKVCQDHLEVFFSSIRSMGGYNNNPSARQFMAAYKRLVMRTAVTASERANCLDQSPSFILSLSMEKKVKTIDYLLSEIPNETSEDPVTDHDYAMSSSTYYNNLSLYVNDVSAYIAGFVVVKLKRILKCETCIAALEEPNITNNFIKIKNYKADKKCLVQPSKDVIHVCRFAETELRILKNKGSFQQKDLLFKLIINILKNVRNCIFKVLNQHALDFDVEGNHVINLIKSISYNYCKVRLHHEAKSLHNTDCRVRSKLTKSILFKNQ